MTQPAHAPIVTASTRKCRSTRHARRNPPSGIWATRWERGRAQRSTYRSRNSGGRQSH